MKIITVFIVVALVWFGAGFAVARGAVRQDLKPKPAAVTITHLFHVAYQVPGGGNPGWVRANFAGARPTASELARLQDQIQANIGMPVVITFWAELAPETQQ